MYTRFADNDIVTRQAQELVTSTWSNNTNNLTVAHTASTQADFTTSTSSGHFHINVYNEAASSTTAEVQYAVSYGHSAGSGSPDFTNDTGSFGLGASRVIYNQYRQLHFNDDTKHFTFGSHTPDDIFVINVNRSRYKQRLTLGSLNLSISAVGKASQVEIHLTDDSVTNGQAGSSVSLGPYYNIVSGSSGVLLGTSTNQLTISGDAATYGLFYPETGVIILNGGAFDKNLAPDTNYTNNESFVDANKNIRFESMKLNPKVFITTVGLYNDAFELLAIAKLSQPVAKDFTKESLIRVKLDY